MSALDCTNGFRLDGTGALDISGFSVASAGDVNGDGFADLIIGAYGADGLSGESYVVFGHRAFTSVNRIGTDIAQTINGGFGDDTINALAGDDKLIGWEGNDIMQGGEGNDGLNGGIGEDILQGGAGDDKLSGGDGNDIIAGDAGNDTVTGGLDDDVVRAGEGNDFIRAGFGNDFVDGGLGDDALSFLTVRGPVGVVADFATGIAVLGGETTRFSGIETLLGTIRADVLTGDGLANTLMGQAGGDTLSGGASDDFFIGGGNGDVMSGGDGNDVFDFNSLLDSRFVRGNRDVITDFDSNGDMIDLSNIDAIAGGADDAFIFIGTAAFTDAGQVRVFQQGGNTFIDVNAVGDARADMRIELTGLISLDAADFFL